MQIRNLLVALLCGITIAATAQQTRTDAFHDAYTLQEIVVLSRHNIRSPISGPESALGRITPHTWYPWSSAPSELSLRGGENEHHAKARNHRKIFTKEQEKEQS